MIKSVWAKPCAKQTMRSRIIKRILCFMIVDSQSVKFYRIPPDFWNFTKTRQESF